jgi:hypothetical protein
MFYIRWKECSRVGYDGSWRMSKWSIVWRQLMDLEAELLWVYCAIGVTSVNLIWSLLRCICVKSFQIILKSIFVDVIVEFPYFNVYSITQFDQSTKDPTLFFVSQVYMLYPSWFNHGFYLCPINIQISSQYIFIRLQKIE